MDFSGWIGTYGYAGIVAGSFLDGETSVVLAGIASGNGLMSFPIVVALAAGINLAWDQFYFWLGRRYGSALLERYPRLRPGTERVARLLTRHQNLFIVAMRFMVGLRVAGPIALGMCGIRPLIFTILNALGALLWALVFTGCGFLFAKGVDVMAIDGARASIAIAIALGCAIAIWHALRWWSRSHHPIAAIR